MSQSPSSQLAALLGQAADASVVQRSGDMSALGAFEQRRLEADAKLATLGHRYAERIVASHDAVGQIGSYAGAAVAVHGPTVFGYLRQALPWMAAGGLAGLALDAWLTSRKAA